MATAIACSPLGSARRTASSKLSRAGGLTFTTSAAPPSKCATSVRLLDARKKLLTANSSTAVAAVSGRRRRSEMGRRPIWRSARNQATRLDSAVREMKRLMTRAIRRSPSNEAPSVRSPGAARVSELPWDALNESFEVNKTMPVTVKKSATASIASENRRA